MRKGIRYINSIAIDDFSLSPECFGLNIPPEELNGYNYWNPYIEPSLLNKPHEDFLNVTRKFCFEFTKQNNISFNLDYEITTCGVTGRYGPSAENCTQSYNNTNVKVQVLNGPGISGIQKWIVPNEGYYTYACYRIAYCSILN